MKRAFVDLGSNLDRENSVRRALRLLRREFGELHTSRVFVSPPYGFADQPDFYNMAVEFHTELDGPALKARLRSLEDELGRVRTANKNGPRNIDLDLVWLEGDSDPHPQLLTQSFVLVPLCELAGTLVHPHTGRTLNEELERSGLEHPAPVDFEHLAGDEV